MKVTLVIPVYNEAERLEEFLERVDELTLPAGKELVLIDDCSTDGSSRILDDFPFKSEVVIVHQAVNQGKGSALRVGFERATGNVIGIQDADFEYDMRDIPALIKPFLEDRADVVFGSRYKRSGEQVHRTWHYLVNRILTFMSNLCTGLYLTDMETCYKFFRRDVLLSLRLETRRFGFEPEVVAKIARMKLRVLELPIRYYPRTYLQGKKITWKDGLAAIWHIFYYNFLAKPSDYIKPTTPERYLPKDGHWL